MWSCSFRLEQAVSVRALQELMVAGQDGGAGVSGLLSKALLVHSCLILIQLTLSFLSSSGNQDSFWKHLVGSFSEDWVEVVILKFDF